MVSGLGVSIVIIPNLFFRTIFNKDGKECNQKNAVKK